MSRDGVCSIAYLFDTSYVFLRRLEAAIPGKTRFNGEKIGAAQLKFFQQIADYATNSLSKINQLIVCGHADAVQKVAELIVTKEYKVIAAPTHNVNLGRAVAEIFQNPVLNCAFTETFDRFKKQLLENQRLVAFGDEVMEILLHQ